MELDKRLAKIKHLRNKVDGILLFRNDPNFFYFTNSYAEETFYYNFSSPVIISTRFGAEQAKEGWIRKIKVSDVKKWSDFFRVVSSVVGKKDVIGINKSGLSASFFDRLKRNIHVRDISKALEEARMIKTAYEIKCIKRACSISNKVFNEVKDDIKPGITENEVAGLFELTARRYNTKLGIITAFGKNTRIPHHVPTGKKLKKGEPVLMDFSIAYKGYLSDVTRMINSRLEDRLRNIMNGLCPMIKPGVKTSNLEKFVRKKLGSDEKYFTHALGHGVGIAIHESPWISSKSKDVLKPGMVFAIEPGIYMKNEGARIEDVFLMTKRGKQKLS